MSKSELIYGFGVNDYSGNMRHIVNGCRRDKPFYTKWHDMIERCYSERCLKINPSYESCRVCDEWRSLSSFKKWFDLNYKEGWSLDKDILSPDSKVYSPETCVFVPRVVNNFFARGNRRGGTLVGTYFDKITNRYMAQCSDPLKRKKGSYIGRFDTEIEAHSAWMKQKQIYALDLISEYPESDPRVVGVLTNMEKYYND